MGQRDNLEAQLHRALAECARLRDENAHLRQLLGLPADQAGAPLQLEVEKPVLPDAPSKRLTVDEKINLFRSLFRGREDVYAVRWNSKDGSRSGYSPACRNEWDRVLCGKPKIKCSKCPNRVLRPVMDETIRAHLTGKHTVGVYPLLTDETCWFLALDFDKNTWQQDVTAFLDTCDEMSVPAVVERSRSGNGGHVWIFFAEPVPAVQARQLGCALLTRTMERRHQIGLDSYDRLFPNQDTMPKGGFGNLIALPLQKHPRQQGNSVFLDRSFQPYLDQWAFLSGLRRMHPMEVDAIVREAARSGSTVGLRLSLTDEEGEDDPWTLPPSRRKPERPIEGPFPEKVTIVSGNLVYVEKAGLPPAMLNRLLRLAAFQNPEFYKAQASRMPTFGKPRVIGCAEEFERHIGLPRGCFEEVTHLLQSHGIRPDMVDERFAGVPIPVEFRGELNPLQEQAADALLAHDIGVLSATTAFGKTVVGAWLIAARKVNTLVLVHRRQLMDQWRERLAMFLDVPRESIGQIGGGESKPTGEIDIGMIQSLNRKGEINDLVADYGQVIVDECHRLPAFSFEQVLRQVKARYVAGLTATPVRKDGHHPITMMQCGPIRFRVDARQQAAARPFDHVVVPRTTDFKLPQGTADISIQEMYAALIADERRNALIFSDLLEALEAGRSPLLLTERNQHVDEFARRLKGFARNVIVLRGGMGKKQRREVAEKLAAIPEGEERILIATGRYIGEGFDDARLDTLFLATPFSWRGTLHQYAGRLHRLHANKRVVQIYDYVDHHVPVLVRMYEKRSKGYEAMGYSVQPEEDESRKQLVLL